MWVYRRLCFAGPEIEYLKSPVLNEMKIPTEDPPHTDYKDSIRNHCIRAIKAVCVLANIIYCCWRRRLNDGLTMQALKAKAKRGFVHV